MTLTRRQMLSTTLGSLAVGQTFFSATPSILAQEPAPWPPPLKGAENGTVTLRTDQFLEIPESVAKTAKLEGAAPFTVAKTAPTVELALHANLGANAIGRRLWSSWGDIGLAADGRVYVGLGDHADDAGGDARCFIYRWDPKKKVLEQVVDMNRVIPPQPGQPAWSKVHAKIDEGPDGKIYFSCTLNDGNRAVTPKYNWTKRLPGGQLYQFDPKTGQTIAFADLPHPRCTATSLLDRQRNVWWCNLEGGGNAMWALDLQSRKPAFQGADGSVTFNRAFALARDGAVYYNGKDGLWRIDPKTRRPVQTKATIPGSPGMRSASDQAKDGAIYGTTHSTNQLFRYQPAKDNVTLLGPTWMRGEYTTVTLLSPDERFLYYLPGSHGGAFRQGTPVIQYDIASGRRKVLAFLAPAFEKAHGYVPAGTYGVKLSSDGGTLYANFNGHPADRLRPKNMKPIGFGLCGFAAVHIPREER